MRRFALRQGLAGLLALALSAGATSVTAETLRIGYQKYGTLVLLKAEGALDKRLAEHGWDVQWTEFPGGPQLLEGLNVGSVEFGSTGEAPPIFAQAAGADLVYVGYEPAAPTAEAILVPHDSPITRVADLKGKRVALNKGSNVHYLLVRALEEAGLSLSDIQPVYLPPADARAAFESNRVDAWVIWDPFQAAAEQQLKARTLRNGEGLVDNHQFYLSSRTLAEQHPEIVEILLEEVDKTGQWVEANQAEAVALVSPLLGLPEAITQQAVTRKPFAVKPIGEREVSAQQKIADTFHALRLIPKPINVAHAVLPSTKE